MRSMCLPCDFGRCRACPRSKYVYRSSLCVLPPAQMFCGSVLRPVGRAGLAPCPAGGSPAPPAVGRGDPRPLLPLACSLRSHRATVGAASGHRLSGALPPPHYFSADAPRVRARPVALRSRPRMARDKVSALNLGCSDLFAFAHRQAALHYGTHFVPRGLSLHPLQGRKPARHAQALSTGNRAGTPARRSRVARSLLPCVSREKPLRPARGSLGTRSRAPAFRGALAWSSVAGK